MSHVDDGRLNALLDGELDAAEADAVRGHIAGCAECAKRLEEAKQFLAGAADLLGALELPPTVTVPAAPVRRVSKTAREVAIDIDGATHQSPAIRPNLPEPAPATRPRFDFTTLSWAAMVVLAVGVGYLADEVIHTRRGTRVGETSAGQDHAALPVAPPGAAAARPPRGGPNRVALKSGAPGRIPATATARPAHRAPAATSVAAKAAPPSGGKRLAASPAAAPDRQPARPAAANQPAAAVVAAARLQEGAAARGAPEAAPAALAADRAVGGNAGELVVNGVAAPSNAPASFSRVSLEAAVARLNGVIRLMDGMRFEQVEVGPGRLVPGADRDRDLVRLVYRDAAGRRLVLDQQRITLPAAGGGVPSDIGMRPGDTLTTTAPGGEKRLRWIDGTFWLSLTGTLPADELRRLIERVR